MLNLNSVMLGSKNPKVLSEFYAKILEKEPDWEDGTWSGFQVGSTHLTIGEHSEVAVKAKEPQRILLNFETSEVEEEFERIKGLGAEVIKAPYNPGENTPEEAAEMKIATLADPDGNYFQLMSPMPEMK